MRKSAILAVGLVLLSSALALGSELDEGQRLFHDNSLGTNGKSCATCHAGGQGLADAGEYSVAKLQEYINFCIRDSLKGQLRPAGDPQLVALEKYVRSFHKQR